MFEPDATHVIQAAFNHQARRLPLYEHLIDTAFMEKALNRSFADLVNGDRADRLQFFRIYADFYLQMGYDTVSYECCLTDLVQQGRALQGLTDGIIRDRADFNRYPFDSLRFRFREAFFSHFLALEEVLPTGMKIVGGVGNGVFEILQDFCGLDGLCFLLRQDPELFSDLCRSVGDVLEGVWADALDRFAELFAVCRFGDDLGYKTATHLAPEDIRKYFFPEYKRTIRIIHDKGKPFLFHSCGNIFELMDGLILDVGIDSKHSNEDVIAPFKVWVDRFGDRIGNFGGLDLSLLLTEDEETVRKYSLLIILQSLGKGGFVFGSGNSIPAGTPVENFLAMTRTARDCRLKKTHL
ncbi:MAG: hypothetical protein MUP70_04010 [Candidatus Aminicenantes bacterium]|nr:hypothetical protein [Candidatus Aminicenantes bacterium]